MRLPAPELTRGDRSTLHYLGAPSNFARAEAQNGVVAQRGERSVRNAEVEGSTPFNSTARSGRVALPAQ